MKTELQKLYEDTNGMKDLIYTYGLQQAVKTDDIKDMIVFFSKLPNQKKYKWPNKLQKDLQKL